MRTYRLGEAAALLGVSTDTVRRLADAGAIRSRRTEGGQRALDGRDLARYAASVEGAPPDPASARASVRNRLRGIVTRVVKDRVSAQVEIRAGPFRLVSLVTREAVDALRLAPGSAVVATIKATNLGVEIAP